MRRYVLSPEIVYELRRELKLFPKVFKKFDEDLSAAGAFLSSFWLKQKDKRRVSKRDQLELIRFSKSFSKTLTKIRMGLSSRRGKKSKRVKKLLDEVINQNSFVVSVASKSL